MTDIFDLEVGEWWHAVELAYNKSIPEHFDAVMVGWVGDKILSMGIVSVETMKKLEWHTIIESLTRGGWVSMNVEFVKIIQIEVKS